MITPDCNAKPLNKKQHTGSPSSWEVLLLFDSEVAARVSGAAETVYYFG